MRFRFFRTLILLFITSFFTFAEEGVENIQVFMTSNYNFVLNNRDLHNIGCEDIIVFTGRVGEELIGGYRGVKFYYYEWILFRNEIAVDTITGNLMKCPKGWCFAEESYFNVFPYAGVYKIKNNVWAQDGDDEFLVASGISNQIIIHDDFLPKLIGGFLETDFEVFSNNKSIIVDCQDATCVKDYYVIISAFDENWNLIATPVQKVFYGDILAFLDIYLIAKEAGYELKPEKKYKVLIGPGANIVVNPMKFYLNQKFVIDKNKYLILRDQVSK